MASNLTTIGFAFADDDAFTAAMTSLAEVAVEKRPSPAGQYAIWRSATGAELWFHLSPDESEIVGLTPFFDGASTVPLELTQRITRPGDTGFEGALLAWVASGDDGANVYPVVFDDVEFAAGADRPLPASVHARLTGFAHQVRAYPTAEAYEAGQTEEPRFAAQSFVPVGMFATAASDEEDGPPPSSTALLTGRVADHKLLANEVTGAAFHWLFVESLETSYDVVADPAVVEGEIVVGGTVEVSCWLFGRVLVDA